MLRKFDDFWIAEDEKGFGNALCLMESWSPRYLDVVRRYKIRIIRLNDRLGWDESDISFVLQIPGLHGIDLVSDRVRDVSPVFEIPDLKTLSLFCGKAKVGGDFSKLQHLESVGLQWRPIYESVLAHKSLRRVIVLGFPYTDLTGWAPNKRLASLKLSSNRLQSLAGIERFPNLKQLHLYRCRNLRSLKALTKSPKIEFLRLDQCAGVKDLSPIAELRKLKTLEIETCHTIRSISPLTKCKRLQRLQIAGNTTIADRDVSPLQKLPKLKELLLSRRKRYSGIVES